MLARTNSRRGNCLVNVLIAVGVLGLLLLIGSVILIAVQGPKAAAGLKPLGEFSSKGEVLEAPGTVETKLSAGHLVVALVAGDSNMFPAGKAPKNAIPIPPLSVNYTVTITDAAGKSIEVKANETPRELTEPIYLVAKAEIPADGTYKIEVKPSDDKTPAGIVIASMASSDFDAMKSSVFPIMWSITGCGGACCGLVIGLIGLIGMFVARKVAPAPVDPLAL
jgi:hypothetical protein